MHPQEQLELIEILEASRADFNAAAAEVPDSKAAITPEAGRWSILQCVEHVTVVEDRFLTWMQNAPRLESMRVDKAKEADLLARVPDRTARAQAPEAVRPASRFATLAEAMQEFNAARTRTVEFAKQRGADMYRLSLEHPRFGPMNGAEFLMVVAGHSRRHAAQIREARAALGIA